MKKLLILSLIFTFGIQLNIAANSYDGKKDIELIYNEDVAHLLTFKNNQLVMPLCVCYETSLSKMVEIQMLNPNPEIYQMLYETPNDDEIYVIINDLSTQISYKVIFSASDYEMTKIIVEKI